MSKEKHGNAHHSDEELVNYIRQNMLYTTLQCGIRRPKPFTDKYAPHDLLGHVDGGNVAAMLR